MISIIIPVFNSEKTLETLCNKIIHVMNDLKKDYEIILINDQSRDRSGKIMNNLSKHSSITGIHLDKNYGQQNALLCGLRYCTGDYAVTVDDDLQYSPYDIPKLISKIEQGYDIVYGVPIEKSHSIIRNMGTRFKHKIFNLILKKPDSISITSFRIIERRLINKIIQDKNSFVYLSAATFKVTKNVANIPVHHKKRAYGKSNYSYRKLMKLMLNIIIYYSDYKVLQPFKKKQPQYKIMEVIK